MPFYRTDGDLSIDDEVSYFDYVKGRKQNRPGYLKIDSFCRIAKLQGYDWVWVDTCCINKSSSAELSEAINSMFAWYRASARCYAYLDDVQDAIHFQGLRHSAWFTRGWTLQELLAPSQVWFCARDWSFIGEKNDFLSESICQITGIPRRVLQSPEILQDISVARRMSWAARRETSRIEDLAYCLLGIFNINMPLLYGEGDKAFYRLQTQIVDQIEDDSLFAWQESPSTSDSALHGLLARNPAKFASCGNTVATQSPSKYSNPPIRTTSRGAELFAALLETHAVTANGQPIFVYSLNCAAANDRSAHLDVCVSGDVLRQQQLKPCSIALTRKAEKDPFVRTCAGKSPSNLSAAYPHATYLHPERFYIRTSWSATAAFIKVYGVVNSQTQ